MGTANADFYFLKTKKEMVALHGDHLFFPASFAVNFSYSLSFRP